MDGTVISVPRLARLTDLLWTGGALPDRDDSAAAVVAAWRDLGIGAVIDCRAEWSDSDRVAAAAPEIQYRNLGVVDGGQPLPDEWFDAVTSWAVARMAERVGVLVHCHSGHNRGPSGAFAVLLRMSWDPVDAIELIREARPIATVSYAEGALDWWHRVSQASVAVRAEQRERFDEWRRADREARRAAGAAAPQPSRPRQRVVRYYPGVPTTAAPAPRATPPQVGERVERLWGCGDLDALFSGGAERTPTPWPRGDRSKQGRTWDQAEVDRLLRSPVDLMDVDPRELYCSQPWILRHHVGYYLTGAWELTGRPSADVAEEHNRFPVVVRNRAGRLLVLSGHHRTAAALLAGRPLRARVVAADHTYFVTPLLRVDPSAEEEENLVTLVDQIRLGRRCSVRSLHDAIDVLCMAGIDETEVSVAQRKAEARLSATVASATAISCVSRCSALLQRLFGDRSRSEASCKSSEV